MKLFSAENTAWTNLAKLYRVEAGAMTSSKEILLHRKVNEEAVEKESSAWFGVTSMVDDDRKVVKLSNQAKED